MKHETTPERITDEILLLGKKVASEATLEYVPVETQPFSRQNECFSNVQYMVKEQGGAQVNGWIIWQWANILIEAEAHSVWESSDGKLIDITPHESEKRILFLRDSEIEYTGQRIGNVRCALTASPLVAEFIALREMEESISRGYKTGMEISLVEFQRSLFPIQKRRMEIMEEFNKKVGPNDPCPCQSGLKYKKCCGGYSV